MSDATESILSASDAARLGEIVASFDAKDHQLEAQKASRADREGQERYVSEAEDIFESGFKNIIDQATRNIGATEDQVRTFITPLCRGDEYSIEKAVAIVSERHFRREWLSVRPHFGRFNGRRLCMRVEIFLRLVAAFDAGKPMASWLSISESLEVAA